MTKLVTTEAVTHTHTPDCRSNILKVDKTIVEIEKMNKIKKKI